MLSKKISLGAIDEFQSLELFQIKKLLSVYHQLDVPQTLHTLRAQNEITVLLQAIFSSNVHYLFIFKRFYLFMREREREREAVGEAGSMQEAQCGTKPRDPRITPGAKGRR